jgi:TetR/AcrR family fatty acid metabolism transcriptional regulator
MIPIVKGAARVFARKGYTAATIGELAAELARSEATIYNHFKNKEDILLSIPFFFWSEFFEILEEHLQGIKSPEEKLRRFVWVYLWWAQKNPDYMKVFLLEIQSLPAYYESGAYELYRRLEDIPKDILKQGMRHQVFRSGLDPELFKDFMLGTMEYLFLSRMLYGKPLSFLRDFDQIAGLFTAAIRAGENRPPEADAGGQTKKETILRSAERLFFQKNFDEVRISDIAGLSNLADGTIYKHFKNKEDILFTIFEQRMEEFTQTYDEAVSPTAPETRLKYLLWHFLSWVQDNRQWAKIYLKDLITNPRFYISDKYSTMKNHDDKICRFFLDAKNAGAFRSDIEMIYFRALVFGTMQHLCAPWAMLHIPDNLNLKLDSFYALLIRAIQA